MRKKRSSKKGMGSKERGGSRKEGLFRRVIVSGIDRKGGKSLLWEGVFLGREGRGAPWGEGRGHTIER